MNKKEIKKNSQNIKTANDLESFLKSIIEEETEYNPQKYKYVIYARKSTDEEKKQVRSLEDQIAECREFADKNNLKYVKIIQESESAKESGIRPKFTEMLKEINDGLYDGILSWHPDRLSRNMKEAGEIIDLIDKNIIKDLKFAGFTFTKDSSGKMLLGISFVVAKEYSDKLSVDVKRGNDRKLDIGKYINKTKHGYIKDRNGLLRPDGNNFILMKKAFAMRVEGKTLDKIAEFLNDNGYFRTRIKDGKKITGYDKGDLSIIMKDPVYTGVLVYGKKVINLCNVYNFIPMISVENFMKMNNFKDSKQLFKSAQRYSNAEKVKSILINDRVFCNHCGEKMTAGITNKKDKKGKVTRYFYYRCDNKLCPNRNKSTRAKIILDYIYNFLDTKPFSSKEAYNHYKGEMERIIDERTKEALSNKRVAISQINAFKENSELIRHQILIEPENSLKEAYKGDLAKVDKQIKEAENRLEKANDYINKGKQTIMNYEQFIELFDNMANLLRKTQKIEQLDFYIRKMYLNFYVEQKKVVKSTLNEPFDSLNKVNVQTCGRYRT